MTSRRGTLLFDLGPYSIQWNTIGGIGLRAAEIAETLAEHFLVRIFAPGSSDPVDIPGVEIETSEEAWPTLLRDADAIFSLDMADRTRLEDVITSKKLLIVENAPPIEHLQYPSIIASPNPLDLHQQLVSTYQRQLLNAHFFLCRSLVEMAVLAGNLCLLGRLRPRDIVESANLGHLISLVPIGFSERAAIRAETHMGVQAADILWTGGIWSYLAPDLLVEALGVCRDRGLELTTNFLYGRPEKDNADIVLALKRQISNLGLTSNVRLLEEPPTTQERDAMVKVARGLVCIGRKGVENTTCVRLRVRDTRLYGVPTIVDRHGPTYDELARDGLGFGPATDSPDDLADVLAEVVRRPQTRRTSLSDYRYDRSLQEFVQWLTTQLNQ